MTRYAFPVETDELCSYGCGNVAKFKNKSESAEAYGNRVIGPEMAAGREAAKKEREARETKLQTESAALRRIGEAQVLNVWTTWA